MAKGGKLVDNLAESLVYVLSENKDLNLVNDDKFKQFTDLLNDIAKSVKEQEKNSGRKIESESQLLYDTLITALDVVYNGEHYPDGHLGQSIKDRDIHKGDGKKEVKGSGATNGDNKKTIGFGKKKTDNISVTDERILQKLEALPKEVKEEIQASEDRSERRRIKMERSIKKTIKSRMGRLWSMFKKILVVGLLLFFAPMLKSAFGKMKDALVSGFSKFKDMTEPVWKPFIEWFKTEFPKVTGFLKEMVEYVKEIGSAIKKIADGISSIIEFKDEHPTLTAGIEGALAGASIGVSGGPVGILFGGIGGFLVGAGIQTVLSAVNDKPEKVTDDELKAQAERIVAGKIGMGLIKAEDKDKAVEEEFRRLQSARVVADESSTTTISRSKVAAGNEKIIVGQMNTAAGLLKDYPIMLDSDSDNDSDSTVKDVDVEGADHTPIGNVPDGGIPTGAESSGDGETSGVQASVMQNYNSSSSVVIINNFGQPIGLDNC